MGRLSVIDLEGNSYSCKHCNTPLALANELISENLATLFTSPSDSEYAKFSITKLWDHNLLIEKSTQPPTVLGRQGRRTFLFNNVVNVTFGEEEEREMTGGKHTVVDIFCVRCGSDVGLKFLSAQQQNERYKVGKFLLERFMLLGPDGRACIPPRVTWGPDPVPYRRNRNRNRD
ncbi:hypothetical protein K1719_034258 [Acacia pycnantha]|nr:hypothetical protein K1719_034258 [Acacia pycnantha]